MQRTQSQQRVPGTAAAPRVRPVDLLAVLPHPDDESSATGGLLARCAAAGLRTAVLTCTGGEEGENFAGRMGSEGAAADLGAIRERELRAACRVLGVSEMHLLGYRDSGMAGSAANAHPSAFVNAGLDAAANRVAALIRALRPRVVVTENADGTYGHPDHVMCHRVTVLAYQRAGDSFALVPGTPWHPERLYAVATVSAGRDEVLAQLRERGLDTSAFEGMLGRCVAGPLDGAAPTLTLDTSAHAEIQRVALLCHRSQVPADNLFIRLPRQVQQRAFASVHLLRLAPTPAPGERDADLFPAERVR